MLAWSGAAPSHLAILDRIQERAERLARAWVMDTVPPPMDTLQHRREVGGLTLLYKAYVKGVEHLAPLKQPAQTVRYPTRAATVTAKKGKTVVIPRPHTTTHFQRAFDSKFSVMWNRICTNMHPTSFSNINTFKTKVNTFLHEGNQS